MMQHNTTIT